MATYKEFCSMELVERCVPEEKLNEEMCKSCEIVNCIRSYAYRASFKFWKDYYRQQKINRIQRELRKIRGVKTKPRSKDFRYVN